MELLDIKVLLNTNSIDGFKRQLDSSKQLLSKVGDLQKSLRMQHRQTRRWNMLKRLRDTDNRMRRPVGD